jgi:hypothetical protein
MQRAITSLIVSVLAVAAIPAAAFETKTKTPAVGAKPKTTAAQGQKRPGRLRQMQAVLGKLNLTPTQKKSVDKLIADTRAQGKAIRESNKTAEQKKTENRALYQGVQAKLAVILDDAQEKKLKAMMAEARKKQQAGQAGKKTAPRTVKPVKPKAA